MAKLEFIGKIEKISDIISIPSKSGSTFNKREVIIDGTTYDRFTGESRENHVLFEFVGTKCDVMNNFKVGQMVVVSFVLQGSYYESKIDHTQKNMTKVVGYDCQPFKPNYEQSPSGIPNTPQNENQSDTAPKNENGEKSDLPF